MHQHSNIEDRDQQDDSRPQTDRMEILLRETHITLNNITQENIETKARHMIYILNRNVSSIEQAEMVLNVMIDVGIEQSTFAPHYAQLISHLCDVDQWTWTRTTNVVRDVVHRLCRDKHLLYWYQAIPLQEECSLLLHVCDDIGICLPREIGMIICGYSYIEPGRFEQFDKKDKLVGIETMVGQLLNVNVLSRSTLYDHYLDPLFGMDDAIVWRRGHVEAIEIEAICKMMTICGKKLEQDGGKLMTYFDMLKKFQTRLNTRLNFMIRDLFELRDSGWIRRGERGGSPMKKKTPLSKRSRRAVGPVRGESWRRRR